MKSGVIKYLPKHAISRNFYYYFLIAGFCSLIDLGLLYALTEWAGLFYLLSATFSFIIAQSLNYYLNKTFNFGDKSRKIAKQLTMFISFNTIGLGMKLAIIAFLVEVLGLWYIPAWVIAKIITFIFSYFMHKRYTFAIFD